MKRLPGCATLSHTLYIVFTRLNSACIYCNMLSKQLSLDRRSPIRMEIFSSAENIPMINKDLGEVLKDASSCCEYTSYVDGQGETRVKIECLVNEEEKAHVWEILTFKHKRDCALFAEPSDIRGYKTKD